MFIEIGSWLIRSVKSCSLWSLAVCECLQHIAITFEELDLQLGKNLKMLLICQKIMWTLMIFDLAILW